MKIETLPVLPLRDVVVYPHMVIPLFVGRDKSIKALETAMEGEKKVLLVAQKNAATDEPTQEDVYDVGTVATILQLLKLPDGTVKVLVEGVYRAEISKFAQDEDGFYQAEASHLEIESLNDREEGVLIKAVTQQFDQFVQMSKKVPSEVLSSIESIEEPGRLADTISAHLSLKLEEKQAVLEMVSERERLEHLMALIESEIDLLDIEKRIRGRVKKQMEKSQREYYLNEQMKAIQKELGDLDDVPNEMEDLQNKIDEAGMPQEAKEKAEAELSKLKMMSPMSAEASVVRGYLDWMISIPWKKKSKLKNSIDNAQEVLDKDHYGLEEVKDRILEFLAVQKRVKKTNGNILCLVGPPGVGKTSLAASIAKATNRQYIRMALGGVRDEAEIRGHRRTYIGSMPGKLMQKLAKVGTKNPLFLFDEIDKMGMDHRGDPASALLEVLDPEQNSAFNDHYLEVDYDLSEVMFICTANSMNIPAPLLDRMEIIRIPGYTEEEKVNICERYLLPKQMKKNGVKQNELDLPRETLSEVIRYYTREAGVRGLEREMAKLCRKVVKEQVTSKTKDSVNALITPERIEDYLGVKKFRYGLAEEDNQVGQVTGLAWTSVGGELLSIESVITPGKGRIVKTGSLGDVMQESIQAALTVVKGRAEGFGLPADFFESHDLHIHVPEGATPKDGPSAGIAMVTALMSVITNTEIRADVAMTGEVTLRGKVLPIGGLKEKLLAAHRGGIKTVIIPDENERDLKEIPENIKKELEIRPVKWVDEVLDVALSGNIAKNVASVIEKQAATQQNQQGRLSTH
ncbi:endopeptidase La [Bermanella marisrubri]|nr:endopeptidase La [Bermanella marisrubri]QIZ84244.1 endopeptidase La [Bermanella marisrubri]